MRERRLFLPVRRRLMVVTCAYLAGAAAAAALALPALLTGILCALLSCWAVLRCRRRKSALLFGALVMALLGNALAGHQLRAADQPTAPGALIRGTVAAIERPYRVYLKQVTVGGGTPLSRDVLVTLMLGEDDPVPEVTVGQTVVGTGRLFAPELVRNPGGFDRRIRALCDGHLLSGYLLPGWQAQGEAVFSPREALRQLREALLAQIGRLFGEQAPLFQALLLGERREMDAALVAAMRLTGTAHLLTVSGLHLSILAFALSALLRRAPGGVRFTVLLSFLAAFTALTGGAPGTVRACIMASMRELARLRGWRYEPLTALSAAALATTLLCPVLVLNASFQFSYLVVLGILLLTGRRSGRHLPRALHAVWRIAGVSLCAQVSALPMQMRLYGYVPLLALPMNLLAGMLMPLLLILGWASVLLGMLWLPAGAACARGLSLLSGGFEGISLRVAALDGAIARLPAPYALSVLLFACLLALLSRRIRWGRLRLRAALAVAAVLACSYGLRFCPAARYVQMDVGQGDAALFRSGRHAVLVDVGPADSYDMLRYLRSEGLLVDAVVLSHLDQDHAGALKTLLESEVKVPQVVLPSGALEEEVSPAVREAMDALAQQGVPILETKAGDRLCFAPVTAQVLSPTASLAGSNERSLLLAAEAQGVRFLLTGDLTAQAEPETIPDCDVLKVAHHGSANATSDAFLAAAQPEVAVISVGAGNRYGHPNARVLSALEDIGCRVLRTDQSGCITLWLRGGEVRASRFLSR